MPAATDLFTPVARRTVANLLTQRGLRITLQTTAGAARLAQTMALFRNSSGDGLQDGTSDFTMGIAKTYGCKLIAAWDAVIETGDTFSDSIADYAVESVDRSKPYQLTATVVAFPKDG